MRVIHIIHSVAQTKVSIFSNKMLYSERQSPARASPLFNTQGHDLIALLFIHTTKSMTRVVHQCLDLWLSC